MEFEKKSTHFIENTFGINSRQKTKLNSKEDLNNVEKFVSNRFPFDFISQKCIKNVLGVQSVSLVSENKQ